MYVYKLETASENPRHHAFLSSPGLHGDPVLTSSPTAPSPHWGLLSLPWGGPGHTCDPHLLPPRPEAEAVLTRHSSSGKDSVLHFLRLPRPLGMLFLYRIRITQFSACSAVSFPRTGHPGPHLSQVQRWCNTPMQTSR